MWGKSVQFLTFLFLSLRHQINQPSNCCYFMNSSLEANSWESGKQRTFLIIRRSPGIWVEYRDSGSSTSSQKITGTQDLLKSRTGLYFLGWIAHRMFGISLTDLLPFWKVEFMCWVGWTECLDLAWISRLSVISISGIFMILLFPKQRNYGVREMQCWCNLKNGGVQKTGVQFDAEIGSSIGT